VKAGHPAEEAAADVACPRRRPSRKDKAGAEPDKYRRLFSNVLVEPADPVSQGRA
jgi:hypothetical protein